MTRALHPEVEALAIGYANLCFEVDQFPDALGNDEVDALVDRHHKDLVHGRVIGDVGVKFSPLTQSFISVIAGVIVHGRVFLIHLAVASLLVSSLIFIATGWHDIFVEGRRDDYIFWVWRLSPIQYWFIRLTINVWLLLALTAPFGGRKGGAQVKEVVE